MRRRTECLGAVAHLMACAWKGGLLRVWANLWGPHLLSGISKPLGCARAASTSTEGAHPRGRAGGEDAGAAAGPGSHGSGRPLIAKAPVARALSRARAA